jgi:hypothetical protein
MLPILVWVKTHKVSSDKTIIMKSNVSKGVCLTLEMTLCMTLQISKRPDLTLRIFTGGSNYVKIIGI